MLTGSRAAYAKGIEDIVDRTVRAELGEIVEMVETRFEDNQQGEASIYVDIFLTEDAPSPLGQRFMKTQARQLQRTRHPLRFRHEPL